MPGQGRLGDKAQVQSDKHGCPGCPHPGVGPGILGSPNVNVNGRPALRVDDTGFHAACCGPNMWTAKDGAANVFINGKKAFRMNDPSTHCGGDGKLMEGSSDVIVGDSGGGGGGGGGSGGGGGGGSSASGAGSGTSSGNAAASSASQASSSSAGQNAPGADAIASSPPPPAQSTPPAQPTPPVPAVAQWKIEDSDGSAVSDVSAHFEGPAGAQDVSGSSGNVSGLKEGDGYSLTLTGTAKAQGKVVDSDGKGVAGVKLRLTRSYGPGVELETDASGKFEAEGFAGGELYEVKIVSAPTKASGTFVDEQGKPVSGVRAILHSDGGKSIPVRSDGSGKYEVEGLFPGEGYTLEVEPKEGD